MKVYVVTQGEYSDYHIDGVFLNKELAEKYISLYTIKYRDEFYIEEYDTLDESLTTTLGSSTIYITVYSCCSFFKTLAGKWSYEIRDQYNRESLTDDNNQQFYRDWDEKGVVYTLEITRSYDQNKFDNDKNTILEKNKKILTDIATKCMYALTVDNIPVDKLNTVVLKQCAL